MEMALISGHFGGLSLVYTALAILVSFSNADQQQQPLQTGIDAAPKRVAVIGKHSPNPSESAAE